MIKEDFLHFIWKFQLFDTRNLQTEDGSYLKILKIGNHNSNAGPDFENARIRIGDLEWAGSVEIHVKASDWKRHKHTDDEAYRNVILHVVWENDVPLNRHDGSMMPSLEVQNIINQNLLIKYEALQKSQLKIPCENLFNKQQEIIKNSMVEKAAAMRLERKAFDILDKRKDLNSDFEELAYKQLSQNFGFKLNAENFFQVAQSLPLKLIRKHTGNLIQIEALLFGVAGFLKTDCEDLYAKTLKREFGFLSKKYGLELKVLDLSQWKFLRTRPQNFPTVRLAQLAAILNENQNLYSLFIENPELIKERFNAKVSQYWLNHYDWTKPNKTPNKFGRSSIENIIINTVSPLLASYYFLSDNFKHFEKAIELLEGLPAEKNYITRIWIELGLKPKNALDSQGLIEQYNEFCKKKRCLECTIGHQILKI